MNKTIVVEFAGWVQCDPKDVWFVLIEEEGKLYPRINGNEYILLNDELREKYILENVIDCMKVSVDDEWIDITILVEDE